jgi:hypothetical protein
VPYSTTFSTLAANFLLSNECIQQDLLHSRSTELHLRRCLSSFATLPKTNRVHKPWSWFAVDLGLSRVERASRSPEKRPHTYQESLSRLSMATGNSASMMTQQTVSQAPPRGAATPGNTQGAISPPSKRELASWWKKFRKTTEKEDEKCRSLYFLYPWLQPSTGLVRMGSALRSRACSS